MESALKLDERDGAEISYGILARKGRRRVAQNGVSECDDAQSRLRSVPLRLQGYSAGRCVLSTRLVKMWTLTRPPSALHMTRQTLLKIFIHYRMIRQAQSR